MKPRVAPDLARASEVIASRGCALGHSLYLLAETESTNDDAKAGAREGAPHGSIWIAETQSRGRGRQGRTWVSPPGENLLFSVLLRIPCAPARVPPLSLVCGLAVRDAVAKALANHPARRVLVKWPNDVVVRDADRDDGHMQKIAGILVESALAGSKVEHIIVGIGLNVHTREFPDDLSSTATSVALERGTRVARERSTDANSGVVNLDLDRAEILADILEGLNHDIEHVAHRGLGLVHARLAAQDALLHREIDGGVACGMDVDGRLLVRRTDGTIAKITSGEVNVIRRPL
jgi:BirA family biotin operon repressor/biotin-[acetyl-CoA-carboxylase] ligase